MLNVPKSKLGLVLTTPYLLVMFLLFLGMMSGTGGLHGSGTMCWFFAFILTMPLSLIGPLLAWLLSPVPAFETIIGFLLLFSIPAGALLNSTCIYLAGWGFSRGVRECLVRKEAEKAQDRSKPLGI
ncbi:MAG: hypothetical protein R2747_22525 [Pyrinomonadaceae bacterium]